MHDIIKVFLLSMMPISELRGAIPYGVGHGMIPIEATIIALLGNALIIPILYYIMHPLFEFLKGIKTVKKFVEAYEDRAARKVKNFRKYRILGIILLVGIPIPTTGVYTGVAACHVLGMRPITSILSCLIGVIISGTLTFLITSGFLHLL